MSASESSLRNNIQYGFRVRARHFQGAHMGFELDRIERLSRPLGNDIGTRVLWKTFGADRKALGARLYVDHCNGCDHTHWRILRQRALHFRHQLSMHLIHFRK